MIERTPADNLGNAVLLGEYDGKAIPVKATSDGRLLASIKSADGDTIRVNGFKLKKVVKLDLSVPRDNERLDIAITCFAVAVLKGSFLMQIGDEEDSTCTIDKCMSVEVTAETVYFSNDAQAGGYAEIWFFTS